MAREFKETAHTKTDLKKYHENYDHIFKRQIPATVEMAEKKKEEKMSECCEECAKLSNNPLPPQYGCNDCYDLLRDSSKQLESRLKDAEKVIGFYATSSIYHDGTIPYMDSTVDSDGGDKARDYQAKYQVKEIVKDEN